MSNIEAPSTFPGRVKLNKSLIKTFKKYLTDVASGLSQRRKIHVCSVSYSEGVSVGGSGGV